MAIANWPEARVPILTPPGLDSTHGKSYAQASQTAGALGGRRSTARWYVDGILGTYGGAIYRVEGAVWRPIKGTARVRIAPTASPVVVDILAKLPSGSTYESILASPLSIAVGATEATGGQIRGTNAQLPVGTLVLIGPSVVGVRTLLAQGSYVGNGGIQNVACPSTPKVVVVKGDDATSTYGVIRTDQMAAAKSIVRNETNDSLELGSGQFTVSHDVGHEARTNESGKTYYWYAFGGSKCITGTYVGDGQTSKAIIGAGGVPIMANVTRIGVDDDMHIRTASMTAYSYTYGPFGSTTTGIISLDADGFTVGSDINVNGETYQYWCLLPDSSLDEGLYVGDGSDDRNLPSSAMSFDPDWVWIHIGSTSILDPVFKVMSMPGDTSFDSYGQTVNVADHIQALVPVAGKFQVGTDAQVNSGAAIDYYFVAAAAETEVDTGAQDLTVELHHRTRAVAQ